jgi:Arc/MetJ family transcription regulator
MTKRHINIDDQTLEEAKVLLGTTTITETVNEALKVVVGIPAVDFEIEWWKTHSLADLP